jgi:hypothetical protein
MKLNYLVPSTKTESVMPTFLCTSPDAAVRGAWTGVPVFTGEVSVMTVADRNRTAILATDQLVSGASAWSPPT